MTSILFILLSQSFSLPALAAIDLVCPEAAKLKNMMKESPPMQFCQDAQKRRQGEHRVYYPDREQIWKSVIYKDNKPHGPAVEYYDTGQKSKVGHFNEGEMVGTWKRWWSTGKLRDEGEIKNSRPFGLWVEYTKKGDIRAKGAYACGVRSGWWQLKEKYQNGLQDVYFEPPSFCQETTNEQHQGPRAQRKVATARGALSKYSDAKPLNLGVIFRGGLQSTSIDRLNGGEVIGPALSFFKPSSTYLGLLYTGLELGASYIEASDGRSEWALEATTGVWFELGRFHPAITAGYKDYTDLGDSGVFGAELGWHFGEKSLFNALVLSYQRGEPKGEELPINEYAIALEVEL